MSVLMVLGTATGASRAAAQQADPCAHAANTVAAEACLGREVEKARAEVARVQARLLARADSARAGELRTAQRSWATYERDHCTFVSDYFRGGTEMNVRYVECELALERERVRELREELEFECSFAADKRACLGSRGP